jgi:hypothetical protein
MDVFNRKEGTGLKVNFYAYLFWLAVFEKLFRKAVVLFMDKNFDLSQSVHGKRMDRLDYKALEETRNSMALEKAFDHFCLSRPPSFV